MPPVAILLTIISIVPFIACGLLAAGGHAGTADWMLSALISYAAVMLAFAGGLYWALTLTPTGDPASDRPRRTLLGAVPVLAAWAALLGERALPVWIALPILIFGHIVAVMIEHQAGLLADLPRPYAWLRWGFAGVAVAMLTTVLMLRITGSTIVF